MLDHRLSWIAVAVLGGITGCTTQPRQLPAFDASKYGISGCPANLQERCASIAGKTFMSYGPLQVEYHSPDGRAFLWVNNQVHRGYWYARPGTFRGRLCYDYGETANCDGDIIKGSPGRQFRDGDAYKLAGRETAPFDLSELSFRSNLDDVDKLYLRSATADGDETP